MFDYRYLLEKAEKHNSEYIKNIPFPHFNFSNFLDSKNYNFIKENFPSPDDKIWKKPTNKNTVGKSVTKRGDLDIKELLYSENARRIFYEFNSGAFLKFLEKLTGINGLISDPHFAEGGFHQSEDGGYLNIHADFSHHDALKLERRLNFIYYLNDDWQSEYNGGLSLYDKKLNKIKTYLPNGNSCIIFNTSDFSFHGHPEKMILPEGVYRRSIALYYYTGPTKDREIKKILFPEDENFVHEVTRD